MKNFKFFILLVVMLTTGLISKAQNDIRFPDNHFWYSVSIGKGDATVTNPNAWLEIGKYGTTKGMILPRTNVFNIAAAEGNFAYDINTKSLWFHNGTSWTELLAGSEQYDSAYLNAKYFPTTGILRLYRVDGDSTSVNVAQTLALSGTSLSISGGNSVSLSTSNVAEGSNLYFTTSRARQAFNINNGLTYNNSTGLIQLGGSLLQNTNIDLGSFAFNIVSGANQVLRVTNDGTITLGNYGSRNDGGFSGKVAFFDANGVLKYGTTSFLTSESDPIFLASVANTITNTHINNWNTAYNDKINSLAFSGTNVKTLTLTQQDGGTISGSFNDLGGVSSIGLTAPSVFTVTNSPITNSGTIDLAFASGQPANQFLGTPNGTTGALGLRALVSNDIPNLDASKITTGFISTARLGSGTASSTTFLRGDNTWQTITIPNPDLQAVTNVGNITDHDIVIERNNASVQTGLTIKNNADNSAAGQFVLLGDYTNATQPAAMIYTTNNATNPRAGIQFTPYGTSLGLQGVEVLAGKTQSLVSITSNADPSGKAQLWFNGTDENSIDANGALRIYAGRTTPTTSGGIFFSDRTGTSIPFDNGTSAIQVNGTVAGADAVIDDEFVTKRQLNLSGTVRSVGLTVPSIFSVTGSPVTTTGTLAVSLQSQTANTVFSTGSSNGVPTFRLLAATDIPSLTASKISDFVANARTSISATTPISYNNSTGVITHANSGATAGTYNNVTINATGHVTSGSNVSYLTTETDPVYVAQKGVANGAATLGGDGILTLAQRPTYTTSNVAEGSNLYYTDTRVQTFSDDRYAFQSTTILPSGNGIVGGGDLSTNRTFGLDFSYLDDRYLSGYKQKTPVRVTTTANITLSGTQTIDGVAVVASDRVLVKNQSTPADNGIYVVAAGAWSRAADFDAATPDEVSQGAAVFAQEGTSFGKTGWSLSTPDPITVGSTSLTFIQYSGANSYTAGTGLSLVGNQFSALTTSAIWNANQLQGRTVSNTAPTNGQILQYNGTSWVPFTPNYLTANQTITLSGDVTGSGTTAITTTVGATAVRNKLSAGTGISYNNSTGVITNSAPDQTVALTAGTGISISGTYPNFTITNTDPNTLPSLSQVLGIGNTANNNIVIGTNGNVNQYLYSAIRSVSSVNYTANMGVGSNGSTGGFSATSSDGSGSNTKIIFLPYSGTAPQYSPNGGVNYYDVLHSNNHPAGSAFTPTLTGANVLSTMAVNSAGHITALTTRLMTAADIAAAPISGSTNYIWNSTSLQSSSNFTISGVGLTNGSFRVLKDGSATHSPTIYIANAANSRAVNLQLNADAVPGLSTWMHNGTSNIRRANHDASTGNLSIYADGGLGLSLTRLISVGGSATGGLYFNALDAASAEVNYGRIWGVISGNTAGSHNGSIQFSVAASGVLTNRMTLESDGTLSKIGSIGNINLAASGAEIGFTRGGANFIRATNAAGYFNIVTGGAAITDATSAITIAANNATTFRGVVTTSTNVNIGGDAIVSTGVFMSGLPAGSTSILGGNRNNYQGGQIALYGGQHATRPGVLAFFGGANATGVNPERMTILGSNGAVGINTTTPRYLLDVVQAATTAFAVRHSGAISTSTGAFVRLYQTGVPSAAEQRLGGILFGNNPTGVTDRTGAQIDVVSGGAWTDNVSQPTDIKFLTTAVDENAPSERMRLLGNGKLAIGTTTAATNSLLHVAGNTTTNGIYSEAGNDLSLWAQNGLLMNFSVGTSSTAMTIDDDGDVAIGTNAIALPIRASKLQVEGNVWATDAYILGLGSTPVAEFGLDGNAFIRTMGSQNLDFLTNASTPRMSINGTTGKITIEGVVQIKGGSPAAGKVLTSDASGNATWAAISGGGGGTVTSVGITSTDLSVAGSPITTAGSFTLNVNNNAITYAKMQDVTAARLLGRFTASNGDPQEITIGTGLTLNSTTGALSVTETDPVFVAQKGVANGVATLGANIRVPTAQLGSGTASATTALFGDQSYKTVVTAETDPIVSARTLGFTNGTGISVTGGTQNLGANRTWTITNTAPDKTVVLTAGTGISISGTYPNFTITNSAPNTIPTLTQVLTAGNTATNSITLGAAGNTTSYSYFVKRSISSVNYTGSMGVGLDQTALTLLMSNDASAAANRLFYIPALGSAPLFSPDNGTTKYTMLHTGNHVAGTVFTGSWTGNNVIGSLTTNASGHITAMTTRTITLADLGAAPASGSANYINNNSLTTAQSANSWVTGTHRAATSVAVWKDGSNSVTSGLELRNLAGSRGVIQQLNADANPGWSTWIHNGTSWVERFELAATGNATLFGKLGVGITPDVAFVSNAGSVSTAAIARFESQRASFGNALEIGTATGTIDVDAKGWNTTSSTWGNTVTLRLNGNGGLVDISNNLKVEPTGISMTGPVGINTASPTEALHVVGNIYASGTMTAAGGGFNSLRTLKKDITDFNGDALTLINSLKLYNFKYKQNDKDNFIGMVIDEKNEVPKELLMKDGTAINTYNAISLLIKSIQQLNDRLDQLEKEIKK